MQHTTKYQLNLIEPSDEFSPDPLNDNMNKVEELFAGQLKFEAGSYTGNGRTSEDIRLEFGIRPFMVIVYHSTDIEYGGFPWYRDARYGRTSKLGSSSWDGPELTWTDNTVSWHVSNNYVIKCFLNEADVVYNYFAIGI